MTISVSRGIRWQGGWPKFAKDAIIEAIDAEIPLLVVITDGIPLQDGAYAWAYNRDKGGKTRIIGLNCPRTITPDQAWSRRS
jgi:succinyl-CoA synthetase alpha subunit